MPVEIACRSDPVIMTVNTPEFRSILTPELKQLVDLFKKHNYEIRVAGGAVRDILMGKTPLDIDFASDATPDQMENMFIKENIRMINTNGKKHGTITPRIDDKVNFEVTTLRVDVETNGRHAKVEFTNDWQQDAGRRDLTINSMYLDFEGRLYDYYYGYDDLQKKRVVFVGDPHNRIREDYLRILRYFRFFGRISEDPDAHDEETIIAIKNTVHGLADISGERIWAELCRILPGRFNEEVTIKMLDCGVGSYIGLPEKMDLEHFRTICRRSKKANIQLEAIAYATALLRKIEDLDELHHRLKFSKVSVDLARFILTHRHEKFDNENLGYYLSLYINLNGNRAILKNIILNTLRYKGKFELATEFENFSLPKFPVKGNDLTGFTTDAKKFAPIIKQLKTIWAESLCTMSRDDLLKEVPQILDDIQDSIK